MQETVLSHLKVLLVSLSSTVVRPLSGHELVMFKVCSCIVRFQPFAQL